jgi:hypothetical protein
MTYGSVGFCTSALQRDEHAADPAGCHDLAGSASARRGAPSIGHRAFSRVPDKPMCVRDVLLSASWRGVAASPDTLIRATVAVGILRKEACSFLKKRTKKLLFLKRIFPRCAPQESRVFCFFFSKKKAFLPYCV